MECFEPESAEKFLALAQPILEVQESINSLMLGLCLRLKSEPDRENCQPRYCLVRDESKTIRIVAMMTPPHKLILYSPNPSPEAYTFLAANLCAANWPIPAVFAENQTAVDFAEIWGRMTDQTLRFGMKQRLFELRKVNPVSYPPGMMRIATETDLDLVKMWSRCFYDECFDGDPRNESDALAERLVQRESVYFWVHNEVCCMAARNRPTLNGESVSYVYTPERNRKKGYATRLVAELSQKILSEGKSFCNLFTDLANPTSNSIYQKIGYKPIADLVDILFHP